MRNDNSSSSALIVCADFGSTWTKTHLIAPSGQLLGAAVHRTTIDTDVMEGFDACLRELTRVDGRAGQANILACSSAGGGLRIAVIGTEMLVTAEAGQRVAMSSGGRIVFVGAGISWSFLEMSAAEPDLLLLVGGTDGGNAETVIANARLLSTQSWQRPVVVACNIEAQETVCEELDAAGIPTTTAANVMPKIGQLKPDSARFAIRQAFLLNVIGGKGLSGDPRFQSIVQGATPDLVLLGVELLAHGRSDLGLVGVGDVAVVDIGGATTDVYSVVVPDAEDVGLARDVVAISPASRTVEGDLGVRWSASSTIRAARQAGLVEDEEADWLEPLVERLELDPGLVPTTAQEWTIDSRLAALGIAVGLRRHAGRSRVELTGEGRIVERSGKDLRSVSTIVASGGAVRHARKPTGLVHQHLSSDGGWQLPDAPEVVIDDNAVLGAAGLLALHTPAIAHRLLMSELISRFQPESSSRESGEIDPIPS